MVPTAPLAAPVTLPRCNVAFPLTSQDRASKEEQLRSQAEARYQEAMQQLETERARVAGLQVGIPASACRHPPPPALPLMPACCARLVY